MKVKALVNFDNFQRGDEPDLPPKYAKAVVEKGLAKALEADGEAEQKQDDDPQNKMAAEPENKRGRSGNATRNA